MSKKKSNGITILYWLFCVVCGLILLGLVGTEIYVWATYAKTPIEEIPLWALWFMFKG